MLIVMGGKTTKEKKIPLFLSPSNGPSRTSQMAHFSSDDPNRCIRNLFTVKSYTKCFFQARLGAHLRGGRFPSPVRDAIPRAPGAGPGEQVTPSTTGGGRRLAFVPRAPEVLTHWLRLPAAARRIPCVWHRGRAELPGHVRQRASK